MMRAVVMGIAWSLLVMGCAVSPQGATQARVDANSVMSGGANVAINLSMVKGGVAIAASQASISINNFMANCSTKPAGHIELQPGSNELTLQVDQAVLLIVELQLGRNGAGGRNLRGAVLNPKPDARYQFNINAVDGKFDYQLIEVSRSGKQELELVTTYSGCRSSRSSSNRAG